MQINPHDPTITLSAVDAAHIAGLLERVAGHEDERARGKVNFPLIVMRELSLQAHHWARFLRRELSMTHPAVAGPNRRRPSRATTHP